MTSSFVDLSGAVGPGWFTGDAPGYYIHKGFVYLTGTLITSGDGSTGQLLATVPAAVRPSAPVSLTIYADVGGTQWTREAALQLPMSYAATLHPDGSLTLDAPPPSQVNTAPPVSTYWFIDIESNHFPRYTAPLVLVLVLGGLRWPHGTATPDSFTSTSLASEIAGSQFANIDAEYAPHVERVHLSGTVSADVDGATFLLNGMPSDAVSGFGPFEESEYDTLVHGPGGQPFALYVRTNSGHVTSDPMKPAGEPPFLSYAVPAWQTYEGQNGEFGSTGLGQNFIDGVVIGAGPNISPGVLNPSHTVDYGTYLCGGGVSSCRSPGPVPDVTLDLDFLINSCDPLPDWFILRLWPSVGVGAQANNGCSGSACGPLIAVDETFALSAGAATSYLKPDGTPAPFQCGSQNWLCPAVPQYAGDSGLFPYFAFNSSFPPKDAAFIWKRGQISGSITISFSAIINQGGGSVQLVIYPLYETREIGLRAGDVLTLDGAGWPGVLPTAIPTSVLAGPQDAGLVKEHRPVLGISSGQPVGRRYSITDLVLLARTVLPDRTAAATAAAIAMAESSGDPTVINTDPGPPVSEDRGLWQINNFLHPEVSDTCAFYPPCAARAMATISSGGTDFTPWATFNSGAYSVFLPAALAVP